MKTLQRAALQLPLGQLHWKAWILILGVFLPSCNPFAVVDDDTNTHRWDSTNPKSVELQEAISVIEANYVDSVQFDPARDTDIRMILYRLDPYSAYLEPTHRERFEGNQQGRGYVKFGFDVHLEKDTFCIDFINPSSTLRREGVCIGDRLIDINGITVVKQRRQYFDSVILHLPTGFVNMGVLRPSTGEQLRFTVSKTALPPDDHFCAQMISDSVIYIGFDGFWNGIADRVDRTLQYLTAAYPTTKDVVIDLRFNHGGSVDEAVALVNLFTRLDKPLISVRSTAHEEREEKYFANKQVRYERLGVTILVNENSYSAAELFSGCMQDLDRALIIGQQTGGKGLVMENLPLRSGASMLLVIGRYYLPSGRCVQVPYADGVQAAHQPESDEVIYNVTHRYEGPYRCDRMSYLTSTQRNVYGGMGIVPDIIVPDHTTAFSVRGLTYKHVYGLWWEFVNRYQAEILHSGSYEEFVKRVPVEQAVRFLAPAVEQVTTARFSPERMREFALHTMMWVEGSYYGELTHSSYTLKVDRSVQEAVKQIVRERARALPTPIAQK